MPLAPLVLPRRGCICQPGVATRNEELPRGLASVLKPQQGFGPLVLPGRTERDETPLGDKIQSSRTQGRRGANPGLEVATPLGLSIKQVPSASQ